MASLLRQIVAGPRAKHPEAGLDLCYVTDNIIATSGPSQTYPQRAYRNPLDRLVAFLDSKHGKNWAIWEFRAEGTGYPDELVYNRIRHYPWPDHHPPPFCLVPMILASMRNWLSGNDLDADKSGPDEHKEKLVAHVLDALKHKKNERVVVVHCKAGKGRSGTMACSYLIAECGWTPEEALARFTERRMRPKFGPGVSIPSQLRWISYVNRWTQGGKKYVDRQLEIVEIHVWGLRNGVKLAVEGYVDQGKKIKVFHTFSKKERHVVEGNAPSSGMMDVMYEMTGYGSSPPANRIDSEEDATTNTNNQPKSPDVTNTPTSTNSTQSLTKKAPKLIPRLSRPNGSLHSQNSAQGSTSKTISDPPSSSLAYNEDETEPGGMAVIFTPDEPIRVPTSDVNITIERRNRAPKSVGLVMVTAVAHVWFNAFFEGHGPEQDGVPDDTGVFEIEWDKLDGIKGSSQKGSRAADRIAVVWKSVVPEEGEPLPTVAEPSAGTPVPQMQAADWHGDNAEDPATEKYLGLRVQSPDSAGNSKASSIIDESLVGADTKDKDVDDDYEGVRSDVPGKQERTQDTENPLGAYAEKLPKPEGSEP
ncbi:phosphatases II [Xylariaceae sp. FL0255]|nr:phosphatases II [Xylariaceae sp. FL0255]